MSNNANHNTLVLANAIALASESVLKVLGGDVSDNINGETATPDTVTSLVASIINSDVQGKCND